MKNSAKFAIWLCAEQMQNWMRGMKVMNDAIVWIPNDPTTYIVENGLEGHWLAFEQPANKMTEEL